MIAIVDYGVGNLFSLKSSLEALGADAVVTGDDALLRKADKIIPVSYTHLRRPSPWLQLTAPRKAS